MVNYLVTLLILLGIDAVWLGVIAKEFNQKHLGPLMRDKFLVWPAVIFYLIYALGIMVLAVNPALETKSLSKAMINGAFLGLTAYSTFDLTSLAVIQGWSVTMTVVDIIWGTSLTALVSLLSFLIFRR